MKKRSKVKYVVLQEYIPASEQKAIKRAVRTVLPSVPAPKAFIERLSQDLIIEARRRHHADPNHTLRTYGLVGGGALSVAGGFLIWLLLKKQREQTPLTVGLSKPQNQPVSIGQA
jgi:hypothetical protein